MKSLYELLLGSIGMEDLSGLNPENNPWADDLESLPESMRELLLTELGQGICTCPFS